MKTITKIKKVPVKAGMQFGTNDYKMRIVGYKIVKQYFDVNPECKTDIMFLRQETINWIPVN